MRTTSNPVSLVERTAKLLKAIRPSMPEDAMWSIEEGDDGFCHLHLFADDVNEDQVWKSAGPVLSKLALEEKAAFVLRFHPRSDLQRLPEFTDVRDICWPKGVGASLP
jgi:hypothetical protein